MGGRGGGGLLCSAAARSLALLQDFVARFGGKVQWYVFLIFLYVAPVAWRSGKRQRRGLSQPAKFLARRL